MRTGEYILQLEEENKRLKEEIRQLKKIQQKLIQQLPDERLAEVLWEAVHDR